MSEKPVFEKTPVILSVVIPSYRRLDRLAPLIEAYLAQNADEIVVILDGPHPGWRSALAGVLTSPAVVVEELPVNGGLALARIAGLVKSTGDVVLITDDDIVPAAGLVERHRAFHSNNPDSALLGYMPVALPPRRGRDQAATYIYARDYENQVASWRTAAPGDSHQLLQSFWGGNASIDRKLYEAAELFKPSQRLNYNEDMDLGLRLDMIGAQAAFDPAALSWHHHERGYAAFTRECVVRGEAVFDMQQRWNDLPGELLSLVQIPSTHSRIEGSLQRGIGARDTPGLTEHVALLGYRISGALSIWKVQDAIARFVRRGLAMRGYRLAERRSDPRPGDKNSVRSYSIVMRITSRKSRDDVGRSSSGTGPR
ncbi:MAG: glycosyltransferase [Glaciihabitans sp.]|nr:glycosyltransferase [Glaciihabitans sp.]